MWCINATVNCTSSHENYTFHSTVRFPRPRSLAFTFLVLTYIFLELAYTKLIFRNIDTNVDSQLFIVPKKFQIMFRFFALSWFACEFACIGPTCDQCMKSDFSLTCNLILFTLTIDLGTTFLPLLWLQSYKVSEADWSRRSNEGEN